MTTRELINQSPEPSEIKTSIFDGKEYKYLPIEVVERKLDTLFYYWNTSNLKTETIVVGTSLVQTLTLELNYAFRMGDYDVDIPLQSGIANVQSLNKSGVSSCFIQKPTEVNMYSAMLYSEAIKNAAKKIGKAFGRDLNREDIQETYLQTELTPFEKKKVELLNIVSTNPNLPSKLEQDIRNCTTFDKLDVIENFINKK